MNTDDAIQGVKNQMHGIHNPGVGGSTPPPATNEIKYLNLKRSSLLCEQVHHRYTRARLRGSICVAAMLRCGRSKVEHPAKSVQHSGHWENGIGADGEGQSGQARRERAGKGREH